MCADADADDEEEEEEEDDDDEDAENEDDAEAVGVGFLSLPRRFTSRLFSGAAAAAAAAGAEDKNTLPASADDADAMVEAPATVEAAEAAEAADETDADDMAEFCDDVNDAAAAAEAAEVLLSEVTEDDGDGDAAENEWSNEAVEMEDDGVDVAGEEVLVEAADRVESLDAGWRE